MSRRYSALTTTPNHKNAYLPGADEARFPDEFPCSACGQPHVPALIAFTSDRQMVALCDGCCAESAALRAVISLVRPRCTMRRSRISAAVVLGCIVANRRARSGQ
jgi:hypothetical protein